ncbi:MAG: DUF4928 domain-containing protein [Verrucomicrobia bacterium]|nr:MAG: DUF4928 domain-containing protein [Verrucomicrobiota bacterium]TAE88518.1 MAG: DUF4928 domain-containing protein [Verrucomicrobiota bacterium]TAF26973.1 MAG: DUF4928 domain-containing protein [Verrucomicrobiota bacterium]TAF42229.1 MAG: DUF4928 domain-containing protein [Verrucomicrobiota bacterium]
MITDLANQLHKFASSHRFLGNKGPLCVALVITRAAIKSGIPLDSSKLVTAAQGQVLGLGKSAVQAILADYGITKVLAAEGGRTSRGSMGNMQDYVVFLNGLAKDKKLDLYAIELWWADRVRDYFESSPLKLKVDTGSSIKTCISGIFDEAKKRQSENRGSTVLGAVMQHLVGAKLEVLYPDQTIQHSGYSVADSPTGRAGDFQIGDCVIHVTTAPGASLIQKCSDNLDRGLRPLVVSTHAGAALAETLADEQGISRRVEVLDITQFLVANMLEWTGFNGGQRRDTFGELVNRYNLIVERCETDPSLKIEVA